MASSQRDVDLAQPWLLLAPWSFFCRRRSPRPRSIAPCGRIEVRTQDREVTLSSYVVTVPSYVVKMHQQIDTHGKDGIWTVSAGDLGALGYTVSYTCLPGAEFGIASPASPGSRPPWANSLGSA